MLDPLAESTICWAVPVGDVTRAQAATVKLVSVRTGIGTPVSECGTITGPVNVANVPPLRANAVPTFDRAATRAAEPPRVIELPCPLTSTAAPLDSSNVHSAAGPAPARTLNV